jgi:hypothetical protein
MDPTPRIARLILYFLIPLLGNEDFSLSKSNYYSWAGWLGFILVISNSPSLTI